MPEAAILPEFGPLKYIVPRPIHVAVQDGRNAPQNAFQLLLGQLCLGPLKPLQHPCSAPRLFLAHTYAQPCRTINGVPGVCLDL